ncbi:MAG: hypothetical protein ACE5JD_09240 [Candidatus Methylomirabilia bacterium]
MNEPTLDAVMQRLGRLERELRRWKALGSAALAVLSLLLLVGATGVRVPSELRAKRFIMVDETGRLRGILGVVADGSSILGLAGGQQSGLALSAHPGGRTSVVLTDGNGKRRAVLAVEPDGSSLLNLLDKNDKTVLKVP